MLWCLVVAKAILPIPYNPKEDPHIAQMKVAPEGNVLQHIAEEALAEYEKDQKITQKIACHRALFKKGYLALEDRNMVLSLVLERLRVLTSEAANKKPNKGVNNNDTLTATV